jgi:hypothetical protein
MNASDCFNHQQFRRTLPYIARIGRPADKPSTTLGFRASSVEREWSAMSRPKKLVPEQTYNPIRVVQLKGTTAGGARAFVAVPCLPARSLSAQERAVIAEEAGINLTDAEWVSVDQARQGYVAMRRNELNGVSSKQLQIRLNKICEAANVLSNLMDGGPGKPGKRNTKNDKSKPRTDLDLILYRSVSEIAWARILHVKDPPFPSFGRDDVYPCVSQLRRRATLALKQSQIEESSVTSTAKHQLIWAIAALFNAKRMEVPRSKPTDHGVKPKLNPFTKFVFAIWDTLPDDVAKPRMKGSAADVLAITRALKKLGPVKNKPQCHSPI